MDVTQTKEEEMMEAILRNQGGGGEELLDMIEPSVHSEPDTIPWIADKLADEVVAIGPKSNSRAYLEENNCRQACRWRCRCWTQVESGSTKLRIK